jgi:cytochrome c oxidase subunit IV
MWNQVDFSLTILQLVYDGNATNFLVDLSGAKRFLAFSNIGHTLMLQVIMSIYLFITFDPKSFALAMAYITAKICQLKFLNFDERC